LRTFRNLAVFHC